MHLEKLRRLRPKLGWVVLRVGDAESRLDSIGKQVVLVVLVPPPLGRDAEAAAAEEPAQPVVDRAVVEDMRVHKVVHQEPRLLPHASQRHGASDEGGARGGGRKHARRVDARGDERDAEEEGDEGEARGGPRRGGLVHALALKRVAQGEPGALEGVAAGSRAAPPGWRERAAAGVDAGGGAVHGIVGGGAARPGRGCFEPASQRTCKSRRASNA